MTKKRSLTTAWPKNRTFCEKKTLGLNGGFSFPTLDLKCFFFVFLFFSLIEKCKSVAYYICQQKVIIQAALVVIYLKAEGFI